MSKLSNAIDKTITVASGTGSYTFSNLKNMSLKHLFIKPTNDTTTYSVAIVDANSYTVFQIKNYKKSRAITDLNNLPNIIVGNFTMTITADNDEAFGVELYISESV